ncbi:MAG: hypothetical protein JXA57_21045 [Armatimonadetes bacterium]|nr:hypothetical protein [Armatimonadota bacterium]
MSQTLEERITCAATKAKNLLGQLGPLVWALHTKHEAAGDEAAAIASDPRGSIRTNPRVDPAQSIQQRAVADIRALLSGTDHGRAPQVLSSKGLRDIINRSIVVYATAILERFLDEATEALRAQHKFPAEKWPADSLGKIERLRRDLCVDLRPTRRSDSSAHYLGTGWLVLVRNAVIHNDGIAPADIAPDAGRHGLERRWKIGKDDEGTEILVWDECDPVPRSQLAGKRFSIAIDHFILPRIRDAQGFVREAEGILLGMVEESD